MPMRFLMVPGSENHDFDEFLTFCFKNNSKISNFLEKVKTYFSSIPIVSIDFIDIVADKKLSFGEKSLLNLYSTLYEFTIEKNHTRESENYLLILHVPCYSE